MDVFLSIFSEKITALYLFKDWWARSAFDERYQDIPERTQITYSKYQNKVICFIPIVGKEFKCNLKGGIDTELCMNMYSAVAGQCNFEEPIYLISEGNTYIEAVNQAFRYLCKEKK